MNRNHEPEASLRDEFENVFGDWDVGFPWRASLTKVARCACCEHYQTDYPQNLVPDSCARGHQLIYPLYTQTHHCKDFLFVPPESRPDYCISSLFNQPEFEYCPLCSHYFKGLCDGKHWIPVQIKDGRCEFFRDRNLTCRYSIPYCQYIGGYRNNYCKLPPQYRDGDAKQGWKWNCPSAHCEGIERLKCYKPIKYVS